MNASRTPTRILKNDVERTVSSLTAIQLSGLNASRITVINSVHEIACVLVCTTTVWNAERGSESTGPMEELATTLPNHTSSKTSTPPSYNPRNRGGLGGGSVKPKET
jgi:hypothetical protein